jgi:two-component system, cell cycle sensor histidine kinase and response regulator CckA
MIEINRVPIETMSIPPEMRFEFIQKMAAVQYIIYPIITSTGIAGLLLNAKMKGPFSDENKASLTSFASLAAFIFSFSKKVEALKAAEAKESLSKRLDIMGKVAGTMAHDINNLLSGIFGSLELLNSYIDDPDANRLIEIIRDCALKAKDLTHGLLSYGRTSPKRWEKINVEKLLTELKDYASQSFPESVDFTLRIDRDINSMNGNHTQIYQVLLNLCVNAKEALNANEGTITVSARNLTVDSMNVTEFPSLEFGRYIHFIVEDTGKGIEPENVQKLFEPYFTTKRAKGGSGLGLYIVYNIIQAHQGTIEVESEPAKGTRFDCYFPATIVPETPVKKAEIIMLIEDDLIISDLLAELFESHDYEVIKIVSAFEAVRILTEELKVSVIISDYHLADMDGYAFTSQIRSLGIDAPVIITTGDNNVISSNIFSPFSNIKILLKPFEFEDLLNTVRELS